MSNVSLFPSYPDAKSKTSFGDGMEYQDFCSRELLNYGILAIYNVSKKYQFEQGESLHGIEIKLDNRCTETKRLSIETYEKSSKNVPVWTPSGILREDNTWLYVQGNREQSFAIPKDYLRRLYRTHYVNKESVHNGTIKRFFIPFEEAERISIFTFPRVAVAVKPVIVLPQWIEDGYQSFIGGAQQEQKSA